MKLMPYGELWRNQRNTTYDERYKFTGKERDEETGYDFFGARNYSSAITTWLSPDPLLDKYPSISSYAYCHWNPINRTDPDGMDDLFDESGSYIRHIDNSTDFAMIQQSNGKQQNITEFSYGADDVASRTMLCNVMTYYGQQVGLNQEISVLDDPKGGEGAMFAAKSQQVSAVVNNGILNSDANTSNNIMNALVHESDHVRKGTSGAIAEVEAIVAQITHPTWSKTTESYKAAIINYLVNNANKANEIGIPVQTSIAPVMPILDVSPISIYLNNNIYSIFINPLVK